MQILSSLVLLLAADHRYGDCGRRIHQTQRWCRTLGLSGSLHINVRLSEPVGRWDEDGGIGLHIVFLRVMGFALKTQPWISWWPASFSTDFGAFLSSWIPPTQPFWLDTLLPREDAAFLVLLPSRLFGLEWC